MSERLDTALAALRGARPKDGFFELWRPEDDQRHVALYWTTGDDALLAEHLEGWGLAVALATNECHLEESCYKVYRLFAPHGRMGDSEGDPRDEPLLVVEQMITAEDREAYLQALGTAVRDGQRRDHLPFLAELEESLRGQRLRWREAPYPERLEFKGRPLGSRMVVGPVHAGVIEPGRFTLDLLGETIEEATIDLGYKRKGLEQLFEGRPPAEMVALAGSVSGDSSVAHELAYCRAVEAMAATEPCSRDQTLRAILLELERIVNHVNDVGALARDVAFEWPSTQLCVLREKLRMGCDEWTGSRLMRGTMRVGGLKPGVVERLLAHWGEGKIPEGLTKLRPEVQDLATLLWENLAVRVRMEDLAPLTDEDVRAFGVDGFIARSSGLRCDDRLDHPWGPYREYEAEKLRRSYHDHHYTGDVLSRLAIRLDEIEASYDLLGWLARRLAEQLADGEDTEPIDDEVVARGIRLAEPHTYWLGSCEGWRGAVVYWLMKSPRQKLFRVKIRDPSQQAWPAFEHLLTQQEIALGDFPLINKSFNLSYAGSDL